MASSTFRQDFDLYTDVHKLCLYYFTSNRTVCSRRYLITATFRKTDCVDLVTWYDWLRKL